MLCGFLSDYNSPDFGLSQISSHPLHGMMRELGSTCSSTRCKSTFSICIIGQKCVGEENPKGAPATTDCAMSMRVAAAERADGHENPVMKESCDKAC